MKEDYQGQPEKQADPVPELIRLLGQAVFIDWPRGLKGTNRKWGYLTAAHMTTDYLSKLKHSNIGVALGDVSGGLCVIDFDDDRFVEPFLKLNAALKETLQTHGTRGRSFWVRFVRDYPRQSSKLKVGSQEVGEFRSNGNQSIVWGIHPKTQKPYSFVVQKPVLEIEFHTLRWPDDLTKLPTLQRVRSHLCDSASLSSLPLCLSVKSVEGAVDLCVAQREHQNNAVLFRLARAMLALRASVEDQFRAFDLWYEKSAERGVLRPGQTRDQYLVEFMNACRKAKVPLGSGPAEMAWQRAATEPLPRDAERFTTTEGKRLVALCWQMHKLAEGGPWFLPSRIAALLTGMSHTTMTTWLSALVQMGILEIVEKHTTVRATRYRCATGKRNP